MYLLLPETTLIAREHYRPQPDDRPIFERDFRGQRVLTSDPTPARDCGPATRYGVAYIDASDRLCIVPDEWNEDDALLARVVRWPEVR